MASNIAILVHGTWGRGIFKKSIDAHWCQEGSYFRNEVSAMCHGDVDFETFRWSGDNSLKARRYASDKLKCELERLRIENPDARITIYSHSHGGNVAMWALNDARVSSEIDALVCLSTPFLLFSLRRVNKSALASISGLLAFLIGLQFLKLYSVFGLHVENSIIDFFMAAMFGGLAVLPTFLLPRFKDKVGEILTSSFSEMTLPTALPCSVLIIRTANDEASLVLSATQFISKLSAFFQKGFFTIFPSFDVNKIGYMKFKSISVGFIALMILVFGAALFFIHLVYSSPVVGSIAEYSIYASLIIIFSPLIDMTIRSAIGILLIVPIIFLEISRALVLRPFGVGFGESLGIDVSVESTPLGEWVVNQVDSVKGMNHSIYNNPKAIEVIQAWQKNRSHNR